MALRSVVVDAPASPPAPRRTVVVRAGGPAPKGHARDVVVGILGLILLIAATGLAWYLPDRTYLNPQFRLAFPETIVGELGSQAAYIDEGAGAAIDFVYDLPDGNIKSVTAQVGFIDDLPYSQPDRFEIEILGPDGTSYGKTTLENDPPRDSADASAPPTVHVPDEFFTVATAPPVEEQIITGLTHEETGEQVLARLEPQYRVANAGAWTIRVTLLFAGDCPNPGDAGSYPSQAFHCRFGPTTNLGVNPENDGVDRGNEFILQNVGYTFYTPEIQELS